MSRSRAGWVYCQSNAGLIGYKVGRTIRNPDVRAAENTRGYGTVYPFVVASKHMVSDCVAVEALAHRKLAAYRIDRSEMFECDLKTAQQAIEWATRLVLRRAWYWKLWYRMTLPRPAARPRTLAQGRGARKMELPIGIFSIVATVLAVCSVYSYKPALPDWLPAPLLFTGNLIEKW